MTTDVVLKVTKYIYNFPVTMVSKTLLILLLCHWKNTSAAECEVPSLANGEVEGAGDAASWTGTFSCHPSFALVGSSTLKCRNGQWSSPRKPVCTAIGSCDAADLPKIANGRLEPYKMNKFRGSVYRYKCDRGYKMWGHQLVHCTGRAWDLARLPICHAAAPACPREAAAQLLGGRAVARAEGGVYLYQCTAPGAALLGSPALVCTRRGWNDTAPECVFGPAQPSLTGPDTAEAGQQLSYTCEAAAANPAPVISWRLTRHGGGEAAQLLQEAEVRSSLAEEGGGWRTVSVAAVRLPRGEATAGLHLECVAENPRTGATLAQAKTISIHFGPSDLSLHGPAAAEAGTSLTVTCRTAPSVPATQVSWIVSSGVEHLDSGETVQQQEDGSFLTTAEVRLHIPRAAAEDSVVVECRGVGDTTLAATHVIAVTNSQTTTSPSAAAETKATAASTAAATARAGGGDAAGYEDYSEDEDDYDYADNAIDGGHSSSEDLDAVYKYAVGTERGPGPASLDLVPLVAKESQETRSGKELDAVSSQEQQQEEEEEFFRPDTVEPRQASSSKLDQATLAETTQPVDSGDTEQSKVPQPKALGTSAAGLQRSLSFVSVVAPILCFKYFY